MKLKKNLCTQRDLPQCYHGQIEQQRCTCSLLRHVAPFGYPQHGHHSRQLDVPFPVNKVLRPKDKTVHISLERFALSKVCLLQYFELQYLLSNVNL